MIGQISYAISFEREIDTPTECSKEDAAPSIKRIHTLSVKVAALLSFAERANEGHPDEGLSMARDGSPYLRGKLQETDVPK
jgi:hypothetical protein